MQSNIIFNAADDFYKIILHEASQRFALPALGRGRRSRPARNRIRRGKMLGIAAESPASGARFVGRRFVNQDLLLQILIQDLQGLLIQMELIL